MRRRSHFSPSSQGAVATLSPDPVAAARALWTPDRPYLNTASYGLPPAPAWEALNAALADWRHGRTTWEPWQKEASRSRELFATLVGVSPCDVAIGPTVSALVGLIAGSFRDARIVASNIEFTSALFPFIAVAGEQRVRIAGVEELAESIDADTELVVISAVQSANGVVTDLDAVIAAARAHGALVLVDATQACGWLPIDASGCDFLVCHGYKWLMSPRGAAFLYVAPHVLERITPFAANWSAGAVVADSYYGPPLRLATGARRLDISPAWFSWVGTRPSLQLLLAIGVENIHDHNVALANRFRAGLALPASNSAIVSVEFPDALERLGARGIIASVRDGRLRASFHVYNTESDVDETLEALRR